jgi:hypothetical protein
LEKAREAAENADSEETAQPVATSTGPMTISLGPVAASPPAIPSTATGMEVHVMAIPTIAIGAAALALVSVIMGLIFWFKR